MAKAKAAAIGMVMLQGCRCRCGHEWLPRVDPDTGRRERPAVCPSCKSPRWDREKQFERTAKGRK